MATKKVMFTVWSRNREKKAFVLIDENDEDIYKTLILKASEKLKVNGSSLVLESNGTAVDEEVLPYLTSEILILLESNEQWIATDALSVVTGSTVTVGAQSTSAQSDMSDILQSFVNDTNCGSFEVEGGNAELSTPAQTPCTTTSSQNNIEIIYKVDCNSEFLWTNFNIPLEKLNSEQLKNLQNGVKNKFDVKQLIQIIVNEMRTIKKIIPMKAFKIVAKKLIDRYPFTFMDVDEDGVVLGDGSHSLVSRLVERNNYLDRPHKRQNADGSPTCPVISKKRVLSARAGCPNWAPEGGDKDSMKELGDALQNKSQEQFNELLEKTYPQIRKVLNEDEPPSFRALKEEWPLLFSQKAIIWHFNKLTNSDIHLLDVLTNKSAKIITFLKNKLKNNFAVESNIIEIHTIINVTKYFKEDLRNFFLIYKNLSDITLEELPLSPCIIQTGDAEENLVFYVYFERELVDPDGYRSFLDSLKVAFALFFVLNLKFPKNLCATMELLQRMFLKIHPDAGSKSKKVNATRKKVFNFMNNIREI